jgi:hypothetical protein
MTFRRVVSGDTGAVSLPECMTSEHTSAIMSNSAFSYAGDNRVCALRRCWELSCGLDFEFGLFGASASRKRNEPLRVSVSHCENRGAWAAKNLAKRRTQFNKLIP